MKQFVGYEVMHESNMTKHIFLFLFLIFLLSSCKTTQNSLNNSGHVVLDKPVDAASMLSTVEATEIPYSWFSGIGSGTVDWDGERYSAKMNVRIERDKIIWVQIQKFGFEIGRMLITPDSAFFINRLERTYSIYNTVDFFKKYNLPADFVMFSKVFTGGAYIPPLITRKILEKDKSLYLESGTGIIAHHWLDDSLKLERSSVTDLFKHEWEPGYSDYRATNTGQLFPFVRTNSLIIDGQSNLFNINYTEVQLDIAQEFPFSIPSHYEKI
jgi:hypothetical protein